MRVVVTHQQLRRMLWRATPLMWQYRKECRGHHIDEKATWRADVLAWNDTCAAALEAQLQDDGAIERRSDAYLRSGVWPLWFFPRVPGRYASAAVFNLTDIPRVPQLLAALKALPDPVGCTWQEVQPELLRVRAAVRAQAAV